MRNLLRTLLTPLIVGVLLLASVSFAVATSQQTVPRATDEVYPCIPDDIKQGDFHEWFTEYKARFGSNWEQTLKSKFGENYLAHLKAYYEKSVSTSGDGEDECEPECPEGSVPSNSTTGDPCEPECPPTSASPAPNQGDSSKLLKIDNPNVGPSTTTNGCKCENPVPLTKVEGNLGKTIYVSASKPIDFVTIKSGDGAKFVSAQWQIYNGKITLSKAVSNYVIWVCP